MTSVLSLLLAGGVIALGSAAIWQHRRYLRVRRERVDDRQPLLYPGDSFHTVTLLKLMPVKGARESWQRFASFALRSRRRGVGAWSTRAWLA